MSYVGDMHLQLEVAVFQTSYGNRIIKITRRLAVNSHDRQSPEVAPLLQFTRGDEGFRLLRFLENFWRKTMWQVVLADHDFNIHAEIIFVAQDLDYSSAGILRGRGPIGDFYVYYYAFQTCVVGVAGGFFP